jgi:putative ABC transport system permease protein
MSPVPLDPVSLGLASVLVLIAGAVSFAFRLGLERPLGIALLRMVVQLALVGYVLKFVLGRTSALWAIGLGLVMAAAAGMELFARQSARFKSWLAHGLGTGMLLVTGTLTTLLAVGVVIGPEPWYAPRYVLPLLGMVLGNMLTGMALTLDALTSAARRERTAIEARIALGSARFEAFSEPLRQALRTGLMPIVNAMAAAGILSLPGMMTGQIVSGVDPIEATKYQLLVMFLIAGSTALGVLGAGLGGVLLLTDERHRLRLDRIEARAV